MERKIIEDQNRHQKMQEEVKEKEVLYKDILKEREEMLERISGYDKEMYRLESQRENRKGKKKSFWIICGRITRSHIIRQNRGSIWMRRRALQRLKETISELKKKRSRTLDQLISMQSKIIKKFPNVTNLCRNSMKIS